MTSKPGGCDLVETKNPFFSTSGILGDGRRSALLAAHVEVELRTFESNIYFFGLDFSSISAKCLKKM